MLSAECLTALLDNIGSIPIHSIGQLLGVTEEMLSAIDSYYENKRYKISHVITLWLIRNPADPVTQLSDALTQCISLENQEIAHTLVLLTSLGNIFVVNGGNQF